MKSQWLLVEMLLLLVFAPAGRAASLLVQPVMLPPPDPVDRRISFGISLDNSEKASIWGYSLWAESPSGLLTLVSRRNDSIIFTDPTATDGSIIGKPLEDIPDVGFSAPVFTDTRDAYLPLQTLTVELEPHFGATFFKIRLFCVIADINFDESVLEPVDIYRIPEPLCLGLVVVAAARVNRRRSAASREVVSKGAAACS